MIPVLKKLKDEKYRSIVFIGVPEKYPILFKLMYEEAVSCPEKFIVHVKNVNVDNISVLKYDLVVLLNETYSSQMLYRNNNLLSWGNSFIFTEPKSLKKINTAYPPFQNIERLRMPKSWLFKLPNFITRFFTSFNLGTIKNLELTLGDL